MRIITFGTTFAAHANARIRVFAAVACVALSLANGSAAAAPFEKLTSEQRRQDIDDFVRAVEVTHPAPFRLHAKSEWQKAADALKARVDTLDANGFFFELQRIAGLADDIHTSIFPMPDAGVLTTSYPLRLRVFKEGLYIRAAAPQYADLVGARIVKIGALTAEEALSRIRAVTPGSGGVPLDNVPLAYLATPGALKYIGANADTDSDTVALRVIDRKGKHVAVTVQAAPVSLLEEYETGTVVGWRTPANWPDIFRGERAGNSVV